MSNDEKLAAEVQAAAIKYFEEGKKRGLSEEQIRQNWTRIFAAVKSEEVQERRGAMHVLKTKK